MTSARFDISVPKAVHRALSALEDAGHEAWLSGSCVRDALLGRAIARFDISTSATPNQINDVFGSANLAASTAGAFRLCMHAPDAACDVQIAPYLIARSRPGNHAVIDVQPAASLDEDLAHRDFTIDAIAFHPMRGFRDYADGLSDLGYRSIRAVGKASERFSERGMRILRGCRLSSQIGFDIEPTTMQVMTAHKMRLTSMPPSLVVEELEALLLGDYVHDALMSSIDVIVALMPEIAACKGFDQRTPYHIYDVWEHIAWVVQRSPATPLARWAALFHDIGKPAACFMEGERAHFFGHALLSATMARAIMLRLNMPPQFAERVLTLVRIHDDMILAEEEAVKRELERPGYDYELLETLCGIKRADALAQSDLALPRLQLAEALARTLDGLRESGETS